MSTEQGLPSAAGLAGSHYLIKPGYQPRREPKYFEDDVTERDKVVWQPDVYPMAAAIARRLNCRRLIDVGCGRAHKLLQLEPEFDIVGIDFGVNLNHCRKSRPSAQWIEADFELSAPLPCPAELSSDSVVICSDVIEHMIRPEALLQKIVQLLEHATVAIISTPERDLTWGADHAGPPPNPCHTMEWNLAEFTELLGAAGLTVEYAGVTRSHDHDPARKTIVAVVSLASRHLTRFGSSPQAFQSWLADLNNGLPPHDGPRVSVIVPTYNRPGWLGETLQSILNQTYRDFEIVVVNDAGPDITQIVDSLNADGRIRIITHERNKGLAAARNTGIRAARGLYIAYLDDDDIFHPHHLATLVHCLDSTGTDVAYTDAYRAMQRKNGDSYVITERDVPYSHEWDNDQILVKNFVPVLCFMHRRHCIEKAGWFDESLTTHEDWDLWIRMSRASRFTHVKNVTCEFRWREDGSSMSSHRRADFLRTAEIIYKKYSPLVVGRHEIAWRQQQHLLEISHSLRAFTDKPTPDTLLVSIVIPVFNKLDLTRACIEAIHRETPAGTFEVIVVDNASSDGTREYLEAEQNAGRLRTIRNKQNYGFSIGCNQGMRAARGGFVLLLNNDTVPLSGWLEPMLDEFLFHQNVAAVGSCLLYPGGELIQHAGVRIVAADGRIHPYHPWRLQPLHRVPEAKQSRDCQAVTAACLLMRRAVLEFVGLLDEGFVNGFEDVDLCFRIGQAGYRIRYCAKSRVIHHESMTPGRNLYNQRNFERLNDRWKNIIQPDESPESTARNGLESHCRQRLITEPANPRALAQLAQLCQQRQDTQQAAHFQERWNVATNNGKSVPISVSIVIPVFNNLELTQQCLTAIAKTDGLTVSEIVVVDNASTDGTAEFLSQLAAQGGLHYLRNEANLGFARACNQGAAAARGAFVLFLNNDTVPTHGWLDAMTVVAHRPEVGVVGAKLLYPSGDIQHAGIGFINGVPDHPGRNSSPLAPEVNGFRELDMVTGACFLMPRDLFLQLGGFDEAYRNGVEDIDLCLRARAAGKKVVYEPQAVVYHLEGQSIGRFDHVNENLELFFRRWKSSFDESFIFQPPHPARIVPASQSILLKSAARVVVSWEGSFLDHGSLSHVNREWTRQIKADPRIQLECINTGAKSAAFPEIVLAAEPSANVQITVRHSWPPNWNKPTQGKLIISQPWEFGSLPQEWVDQSAAVDEFWVPTQTVRQFYIDSGIPEAKVKIVTYGVDIERFHPKAKSRALQTTKSFRFLFVGGTIWRKGPDVLLSAFLRTFTAADDVSLVIKDFGGKSVYQGQTLEDQIKAAQQRPNAPEILYLNEEFAPEELPGLYTACDCLVHPYRGEGFGLPVLEAMACGLPVIVTGGGATDDFATDDFAYRLPSTRKEIGHEISGLKLAAEGWLLEPDADALAARMQWCFTHREEARVKGRAASEQVRDQWTWEKAGDSAVSRLIELQSAPKTEAARPKSIALPSCAELGNLTRAKEFSGRGKHAEAWIETLGAIEVRPFHPEAWMHLAKTALAAGNAHIARECAERVRKMAPHWETPKQFLRKPLKGNSRPDWLKLPAASSSPRLTVCLIARNEERFIEQCIGSVRDIAHQIILVDTGSTDNTVAIASSLGAEIHHFTWCDDFSAARNAALQHARGDWILVLDADEELPREQHAHLLKDIANPRVIACRLPLVNPGADDERVYVPRLFRNAPKVFFSGRIHEHAFGSLLPNLKTWGMEIGLGSAQILHHGYSEEFTNSHEKIERNLRLLQLAATECPNDANIAMNLALEFSRSGNEPKALAQYRHAFRLLGMQAHADVSPELRETLISQFITILIKCGQKDEVLRVLNSPAAKRGMTASLHYAAGLVHLERKLFRPAADHLGLCIAKRHESTLSPINKDILSAAPHHCLALALAQLDDRAGADRAFRTALAEKGKTEIIKLDYAKFLAQIDNPVEALKVLYEIVTENSNCIAAWNLGANISVGSPELLEFGCDWTKQAVACHPASREILLKRAEVLLLVQNPDEALVHLRNCTLLSPAGKAVLIACQLSSREPLSSIPNAEERTVSHEFIQLYRRLLEANAKELILLINDRLDVLASALPLAAQPLQTAVHQANTVAEVG